MADIITPALAAMIVIDDTLNCDHPKIIVEFDEEAAKGLDKYEVRRRWPRAYADCPDCKQRVIKYASFAHYLAGDW